MSDLRPTIMTVSELADYLRLHEQTIYKMAKEGNLPGSRVGNRWRFEKDQIDKWLRDRQSNNGARESVIQEEAKR